MNLSLFTRHSTLCSIFFGCLFLPLSLSLGLGSLKAFGDISWLDILGEGSLVILSAIWVLFVLVSRPPGIVTSALVIGLSLFLFSASLDLLDEWMHYDDRAAYLSMFESIPAAFGMFIMTYALYQWHQELLIVNQQLQRRESNLRQHKQVDFITKLYGADYMRQQINDQLRDSGNPDFSVVMLDIDNFDSFNRRYGHVEGDRLLREISEVILMNVRSIDLVCRYAGDRFILLLPDTDKLVAEQIAEQVHQAIAHLAFKPNRPNDNNAVYHTLTYAAETASSGDKVAEAILSRVNRRLDQSKHSTAAMAI